MKLRRRASSSISGFHYQYDPLWKSLDKEAIEKVRKGNYERIFDDGGKGTRVGADAHDHPDSELGGTTP